MGSAAMPDATFGSADEASAGVGDGGTRATSRRGLLETAALLGGSALATGGVVTALAGRADPAPTALDIRILNYVLRLERLKAAFYLEAASGGGLGGELQQFAELLARHEQTHVAFLRRRLGSKADDERTYEFGAATRDPDVFAQTARTLEEAAVAAYIGQGANLSRSLMVPFAEMCSVEARHAAWIDDYLASAPAPRAADEAMAPADVVAVIEETGFETG
jgi:Ferritin-like domain